MQINLLAPSTAVEMQKKINYERRNPVKPLLGLSLALVVIGYGTLYFLEGRVEKELATTNTKIAALDEVASEQNRELTMVKDVLAKREKLKAVNEAKVAWQGYFDSITASMPTSVKLNKLVLEGEGTVVKFEGTAPTPGAIAQFAAKLQATKPFKNNLLLVKTERNDKEKYDFTIDATTTKVGMQEVKPNE